MKVVVLGAGGMLGSDVSAVLSQNKRLEVCSYDRSEVDVCNADDVRLVLRGAKLVVNCAAYTAVDLAEIENEKAYKVNLHGAQNVAVCAHAENVRLIHTSTDYVFDGTKGSGYTEKDAPNPVNVYGSSKLAGEKAVRSVGGNYAVLRLQALFGLRGGNFVEAILKQFQGDSSEVRVVGDQITIPTYTRHIAEYIEFLSYRPFKGLLNVSATGFCSWHEFALEIAKQTGCTKPIVEVTSDVFPRPALRPMNSVLCNDLCSRLLGTPMPHWKEGLEAYLKERESK